jgi:S1-C subfamily serine protease
MEKNVYRQPSGIKKTKNGFLKKAAIPLFASVLLLGLFLSTQAHAYNTNDQTNVAVSPTSIFLQSADLPRFQVNPQISISQLYQNAAQSLVVITDLQPTTGTFGQTTYTPVEGSGFVYNLNGRMIIVTNFHVINQGINISVTFKNGNGYAATVLGADPYADLAALSTNAPADEYHPIDIASSSSLNVGDFVAALGSPFGLSGSMTTGIVSQLGRTITESTAGNFPIANVIQTDAPINPGNSGGPLLNDQGQVVGINTAGVSGSQGVGFAIPSDTILKEINSLVQTGTYTQHAYMGISGVDNSYDIASQTGLSATYGVLIQQVVSGGPAAQAGLQAGTTTTTIDGATLTVGGDLIIAINNTRIINNDAISTYLEQNTLPNQQVTLTILRNNQNMNIPLTPGTRPPPSGFTPPSPQPTTSTTSPTSSPTETQTTPSTTPVSSPTTPASSSPAIPEITTAAIATVAVAMLGIALLAKRNKTK